MPESADAATLLERARADAEKLLVQERQRIEQERVEAVEALRRAAIELAVTIARRLLTDATEASWTAAQPRPCQAAGFA